MSRRVRLTSRGKNRFGGRRGFQPPHKANGIDCGLSRGKTQFESGPVSGHDFSRAVSAPKLTRASVPEGWPFRLCGTVSTRAVTIRPNSRGSDFASRAIRTLPECYGDLASTEDSRGRLKREVRAIPYPKIQTLGTHFHLNILCKNVGHPHIIALRNCDGIRFRYQIQHPVQSPRCR
jgi:hypothetical protein